MSASNQSFIVSLHGLDEPGIPERVEAALAGVSFDIAGTARSVDRRGRLFMRLQASGALSRPEEVLAALKPVTATYDVDVVVRAASSHLRMIVMVSKLDHCLRDLLDRCASGEVRAEVCAIVSNHDDHRGLAAQYGVPYYFWPVCPETKRGQEREVLSLFARSGAELLVLARYMQILSPWLCDELAGRIINIHPSLLPSFKGAQAYRCAVECGVKLIGATAHYVTENLDEGPIIEQSTCRVTGLESLRELARLGAEAEVRTLSRAVQLHAEGKVFLTEGRTVVLG